MLIRVVSSNYLRGQFKLFKRKEELVGHMSMTSDIKCGLFQL